MEDTTKEPQHSTATTPNLTPEPVRKVLAISLEIEVSAPDGVHGFTLRRLLKAMFGDDLQKLPGVYQHDEEFGSRSAAVIAVGQPVYLRMKDGKVVRAPMLESDRLGATKGYEQLFMKSADPVDDKADESGVTTAE